MNFVNILENITTNSIKFALILWKSPQRFNKFYFQLNIASATGIPYKLQIPISLIFTFKLTNIVAAINK